jgi:phosphohistidine swiveling domain-containing protein
VLRQAVEDGSPLAELQERHPDFAERFARHTTEFGCRALRHELAFPTVAESPELLLRLLRDQLRGDYDPEADERRLREQRQAQLAEANGSLRDRPEAEKERFERARRRAEKAYPVREEHGLLDRDAPVALLRYGLLETGRRLVERGQVSTVDDVFYLEFEEVERALAQRSPVTEVVARRKAERKWVLANPGPASYGQVPSPPPSMAAFPKEARESAEAILWTLEKTFATEQSGQVQHDASNIKGIAASSGQYTGTVRVIKDESEFHRIEAGDVMVCPITSPVWSMLFPSIGALVTDSGGILSHSAIIAREYRIPAVVATGNATELLVDGQNVTVDGATGEVRALD